MCVSQMWWIAFPPKKKKKKCVTLKEAWMQALQEHSTTLSDLPVGDDPSYCWRHSRLARLARNRCCKHCLLFDSIACTRISLCSFLLTCMSWQSNVFSFTASGLCLSWTHSDILCSILGRMVLRVGLALGFLLADLPFYCTLFEHAATTFHG